jgi:hypothetical protein
MFRQTVDRGFKLRRADPDPFQSSVVGTVWRNMRKDGGGEDYEGGHGRLSEAGRAGNSVLQPTAPALIRG